MNLQRLLSVLFVMVVMVVGLRAQSPQRFSYQSVVRNASGALVAECPVGLRISIVRFEPQGEVVYVETHQPVTNSNGLLTVLLGGGEVQHGRFDSIRWSDGPYFVKSEMDLQGGTAYTMEVVQQLVSVPYALHAASADMLTHPVNYDSIVNAAINNAGFLLSEQQTLSAVMTLGNSAGNNQLKELQDPTDAQDAVTYHQLQEVQQLIASLQTRVDSLRQVVRSDNNNPVTPTPIVVLLPTLTTSAVTNITITGAVSGGTITFDGGSVVTARGVCWGASEAPTISNCLGKTEDGTGMGAFSSAITGLSEGSTYYVRAYATNSAGTAYGEAQQFTASGDAVLTLTTTMVTNISETSAISGGTIISDGRTAIAARGVCWSTSSVPTVDDCLGKTSEGTGSGSFISIVTGLTWGTTYYVRAYAINDVDTAYGEIVSFTTISTGTLSGLFSVATGKQVRFAQGNLQYISTGTHACADGSIKSGTWRFADHQYDYVGSPSQIGKNFNRASGNVSGGDNALIGVSYTGQIDLFGWGASGYNGCNPYLTTTNYSNYGPSGDSNLTGNAAYYDWGVYNAISNGGNKPGRWRLLTIDEWEYLCNGRDSASFKHGSATVNGVYGVVFLPDSWTLPEGCSFNFGDGLDWATNTYNYSQWNAMEAAGALFLPVAGSRKETSVYFVGGNGRYWSSTVNGDCCAHYLYSAATLLNTSRTDYENNRNSGYSVRMVAAECLTQPTIATTMAISITPRSAVLGGSITSDDEASVTACGVCWSTSSMPTVENCLGKTTYGYRVGSFSRAITDLMWNTTYYVRAYATNSKGTAYGEEVQFTTLDISVPTLTTTMADAITYKSAVLGGNISDSGGLAVTARGVCWSTSSMPTVDNCLGKTSVGTGVGSFSSTLTGLSGSTTYYVRAYATNGVGTAYGDTVSFTTVPTGALSGLFSVANGKQVRFAQGNLQYSTTKTHVCADGSVKDGTWRFADHQYDYIGSASQYGKYFNEASGNVLDGDNAKVGDTCKGWIDLFGWGTSGYNGCNPYLSTTDYSDYGASGATNITGDSAYYDWGIYNAISNGGNEAGKWRLLTNAEWNYLCNKRGFISPKNGLATVEGVHGIVFLPDSWTAPKGYTFEQGHDSGWTTNTYTAKQWETMELSGAVFLPAAGRRLDTSVSNVGSFGYYWSSTANGNDNAYYMYLVDYGVGTYWGNRCYGSSVRLVCE